MARGRFGTWLARLRTRGYAIWSDARMNWMRTVWGMDIGPLVRMSSSAKLDKTNPKGVHIGHSTLISFDAAILTHDFVNNRHVDTWIGSFCFIGARSVIMPGVRVGDHCVIGAGSVVTTDIPSNSLAVGNPARILRSNIETARWGIFLDSFTSQERFDQSAVGRGTGFKIKPKVQPTEASAE